MKTITFKPEFEKKLIELRIKTKFVKNIIAYKCNKNDSIEKFIFFLNKYGNYLFIVRLIGRKHLKVMIFGIKYH